MRAGTRVGRPRRSRDPDATRRAGTPRGSAVGGRRPPTAGSRKPDCRHPDPTADPVMSHHRREVLERMPPGLLLGSIHSPSRRGDLGAAIEIPRDVSAPWSSPARWSQATASRRRMRRVRRELTSRCVSPIHDESPGWQVPLDKRARACTTSAPAWPNCAAASKRSGPGPPGRHRTRRPRPGSRGTTVTFVHPRAVRHADRARQE